MSQHQSLMPSKTYSDASHFHPPRFRVSDQTSSPSPQTDLNKPHSSYHAIRPTDIIQVLSTQTEGRTNSLFYSREHQDAQELFQVISECIKNEITAVDKEAYRDRGLGGLAKVPPETMRDIGKSVFDGLTANRRSCCICGYTEAVMHFALDNWQLAVPRLAVSLHRFFLLPPSPPSLLFIRLGAGRLSIRRLFRRLHPPRSPQRLYLQEMFHHRNS